MPSYSNNLNVISDIKQSVLGLLLSDADVVRIVRDSVDVTLPDKGLRYTQVYPWAHVPEVAEEAKSYITFEVAPVSVQNCAVKTYELRVYAITHESLMVMNKNVCDALGLDTSDCGTRVDVLADKIDWLLNGSTEMGFTKMELVGAPMAALPAEHFIGRVLVYRVQGWNRYGEKL